MIEMSLSRTRTLSVVMSGGEKESKKHRIMIRTAVNQSAADLLETDVAV